MVEFKAKIIILKSYYDSPIFYKIQFCRYFYIKLFFMLAIRRVQIFLKFNKVMFDLKFSRENANERT